MQFRNMASNMIDKFKEIADTAEGFSPELAMKLIAEACAESSKGNTDGGKVCSLAYYAFKYWAGLYCGKNTGVDSTANNADVLHDTSTKALFFEYCRHYDDTYKNHEIVPMFDTEVLAYWGILFGMSDINPAAKIVITRGLYHKIYGK